jgi:hypothetical protein
MKALLTAAEELPKAMRPRRLVVIRTTGIDPERPDVHLLLCPMYRLMLEVPHADKTNKEDIVHNRPADVFPETVLLRPSLLTNGPKTEGIVRIGKDVLDILFHARIREL